MNKEQIVNNPILYKEIVEQVMICPLCEGSHGNNTLCQMSMEDGYEIH